MLRAVELAAGVRTTTSPNPWVGCVLVTADGRRGRGRHRSRPAGPTPRPPPWPPPATPGSTCRRHRLRHARAVQPPRPHPAVRRRARRRRRRPGRRRDRRPRPAGAGRGIDRLRAAGVEVDGRRGRRRGRRAARALPHPPDAPAAPTSCSSWPPASTAAPPPPTAPAGGSPARPPGPTPTGSGPRATPSSSAPAPSGPTTPTLTVRHVARARPAAGRARPGAARGAGPPVRSRWTATSATSSTTSAPAACCRCWSRAAPPWPAPSTGPASSTATSSTWRPALFGGDDAPGLFSGAGAATMSRRLARADRRVDTPGRRHPRRPAAAASEVAADVHRHRRGAGRDRRDRPRRVRIAATRARRTPGMGDSIAVDGCCLTVVRQGDGLVGGRRLRRDARSAPPSATASPATR